ncbi:DUF3822 family protein [Flavobacterium sp.]|uniref:DUF3822 family protein n=1 Tax=Flavobacterium sp. TaxID=239 RepID=UPI00286E5F66|nr:DUF3822 family protein [Flavobacterium sp.]
MQISSPTILDKKYIKLVLQISLSEISFCIVDTLSNKIETIGNYPLKKSKSFSEVEEEILSFIKKTPLLQSKFDSILVLHNNNLSAFVPHVLFDEQYLGSYLQYNTKVFETDFFTFDEIPNYDMNSVYIPYVNINNSLIDLYGSFDYKHSYSILVKKVLDLSKNNDEPQVFVHCQNDNFQIIVVKNQKLILFNSFEYKTKEDFIYFLLFTVEQLQLNPEVFHLKMFGGITKDSEIYQIAYKYIRNISLFFENNDLESKISQQEYLQNFILIHACE